MIFQQIEEAEQNNFKRTETYGSQHRRRGTIEGRPVSISKKELAQKLTDQTTGSMRPKQHKRSYPNQSETSFDQMLRD